MGKLVNLNETRKKIEKKKVIMNFIFIIITLYIIYAVYLIIKTPSDTITIENGTLTAEESSTGYIIRNETIVKGKNYKNGINQILLEGEKAAKKQTIFRYYGINESELQTQIDEVNEKIQKALEKEKKIPSSDIKNLEDQIDAKIQDLKTINDVKDLSEYKKQLSEIMMKKATIAGENSKSGSYIKKLMEKKDKYEKKLIEGSEYMVAPESGIVSYRVDGLENVLRIDEFEDLTEQKLNELDVKTGQIVSTSNEEAKVINNFECYIGAILDSLPAKQAETGKNVILTLSNGTEVNATIHYTKVQEDGKILIIFKVNTLTDELRSYRKISFNITWWSVAGIKVPNEAILEDENHSKYVLKKTMAGTTKCYIKIKKTNERYSIIGSYTIEDLQTLGIDTNNYRGIDVYDTIMLYPKK
ncbi:MAG: hypothetical protein IJK18_00610 [Clostridia bacterium]|nr:hypothetical protein [Clostridia bacterium]